MSGRARGYIIYTAMELDFPQVWCVDCRASETQADLEAHFVGWARPGATFIGAIIVPDDPTPTSEDQP